MNKDPDFQDTPFLDHAVRVAVYNDSMNKDTPFLDHAVRVAEKLPAPLDKKTLFLVVITKQVIFKDKNNVIFKAYEIDDVHKVHANSVFYYATQQDEIYHDEARILGGEELITYTHADRVLDRFRQYAKDPLPAWACDIKLERT